MFRRKLHDGLVKMRGDRQRAVRGLFDPFPPTIECVHGHYLNQADRKRQLDVAVATFVPVGEFLKVKWNVPLLKVAAVAKLLGYVAGDVL